MYFGSSIRAIYIGELEMAREMLQKRGKTFAWRIDPVSFGQPGLGRGVIFSSGRQWQRNRRFALRTMRDFGMGKSSMVEDINRAAERLVVDIDKLGEGVAFEPWRLIALAAANVVGQITTGQEKFQDNDPVLNKMMSEIEIVKQDSLVNSLVFYLLPFLRFFKTPTLAKCYLACVNAVQPALIKSYVSSEVSGLKKPQNFAQAYLAKQKDGDAIDFQSFIHTVGELFGAGFETVATSISWFLLFICLDETIQAKCHEEIDKVLGESLDSNSHKFNYVQAVLNETQRKASIVPLAVYHSNLGNHAKVSGTD